jgi:cytochrome c oxidase assembly factor CtaG
MLHALALWFWHAPALFDAALKNAGVHAFQQICFLLTSLVFWWSVFSAATPKKQGLALVSLFTTMAHTGALGALLALSGKVWYPRYGVTAPVFGMTVLQDQQLGGLVMWVPAGLVYLCGLALAGIWMNRSPARRTRAAKTVGML